MKRLTCFIGLFVICLIGCSETTDPPQVSTPPAFNSQSPVEDSPPGFGVGVTVERNNPAAVDEKAVDELLVITPGHSAFGVKIGDIFAQVADVHKAPFEIEGNFIEGHALHYDVPPIGVFGVWTNEQNQVHTIIAIHPNSGQTAGGNGIGSVLNNVQREFGKGGDSN